MYTERDIENQCEFITIDVQSKESFPNPSSVPQNHSSGISILNSVTVKTYLNGLQSVLKNIKINKMK
jgi:hypothetical protein